MSINILDKVDSIPVVSKTSVQTNQVISDKTAQDKLAQMLIILLQSFAQTLRNLSEQEQLNCDIAQTGVTAANINMKAAQDQAAQVEKQLYDKAHQPWWKTLINIVVKYVLPIAMCIASIFTFGLATALVCAVVTAISLSGVLDPNSKQGALGRLLMNASTDIGKALGIDPNIVMTVLTTVVIVALTAGAGACATTTTVAEAAANAGEEAAEESIEMTTFSTTGEATTESTETATSTTSKLTEQVNKFNNASKKFTYFHAASSLTGSLNPGYYVAMSVLDAQYSSMDDDKKKAIAEICSMVFNIIVNLISMVGGISSISDGGDLAGNISFLSKVNKAYGAIGSIYKGLNISSTIANIANGLMTIYQGQLQLGGTTAEMQKLLALVKYSQDITRAAYSNQTTIDGEIKTATTQNGNLLQIAQNWALPLTTEAHAMLNA